MLSDEDASLSSHSTSVESHPTLKPFPITPAGIQGAPHIGINLNEAAVADIVAGQLTLSHSSKLKYAFHISFGRCI